MQSQESDVVSAFLAGAVSDGASSAQIAEQVASAFGGIDRVLMPIIGQRGVAALYKRTIYLASHTHPWLPVSQGGACIAMDVAALTTELAKRSAADAAAAGTRLLQTFYELLTSLIGSTLTERLLRPVWVTFLSGPPAQDNKL